MIPFSSWSTHYISFGGSEGIISNVNEIRYAGRGRISINVLIKLQTSAAAEQQPHVQLQYKWIGSPYSPANGRFREEGLSEVHIIRAQNSTKA